MATKAIDSLVGFRALPACVVLLGHLAPTAAALLPTTAGVWHGIDRAGYIAVDAFFMLSGFSVMHGYGNVLGRRGTRLDHARFLWMRLARLYPTHIAILLVLAVGAIVSDGARLGFAHGGSFGFDLPRHVFLVQGWGFSPHLSWNGPTWSISAEWACYLLFPIIAWVIRPVARPRWATLTYCAVLLAMFAIYGAIGTDDPHLTYLAPLWRTFADFAAGCLIYRLYQQSPRLTRAFGRLVFPLLVILGVSASMLSENDLPALWSVILIGPIIVGVAHNGGLVRKVLSSRPAQKLGRLSFAIFMVQVPCLLVLQRFVTPGLLPGMTLGSFGVGVLILSVYACALMSYHLVERPCQQWMRTLWTQYTERSAPHGTHLPVQVEPFREMTRKGEAIKKS